MQDVIALALQHAEGRNARRIHRISLRVGALSGVVPEALTFAFDIVAKGTMADGARLEIEPAPAVCHCAGCDTDFSSSDPFCECPRCGVPSLDVRAGKELMLTSLEVT